MPRDFLTEIVAAKEREIAAAQKKVPEEQLKEMAATLQSNRSLTEAMVPSGVRIIAEIKKASPSKGPIRLDLDPAAYASAYQKGGAAAISVLTDAPYFKGHSEDLKAARSACDLPVLRKEFILSSYQMYETAAMGADAVLLIVRILSEARLASLLQLADDLSLDALVEVHAPEEVKPATRSGARLIGINNRNLQSFETDTKTASRLASLLSGDQIAIAASGIAKKRDIETNISAGISRFLVGESIVRSENPEAFIRNLTDVK